MPKAKQKPATTPAPTAGPSRLVIEYVDPASLTPAPYNPRTMTDEARARLERGIREFGLVDPVIARRADRLVIGGHQRLRAATTLGLVQVPVVFLDAVDDQRAAALNVLLNNPAAQGEWDMAKLSGLVSELDANGFDATLTGFDEGALEELLAWEPPGVAREEAGDVDLTPPAEPKSQRGEVYQLGRHRLMCGDSTSEADVATLLNGATPLLMVTDPPYGVDYDPEWRNEAAAKGHLPFAERRTGRVLNDDRVDWSPAWALFPGDVAYCWHADRHASEVQVSLLAAGFVVRSQIIWAKPHLAISRGHYHWQHEPCWYAVREGRTAHWIGDRAQTTLWQIAPPHQTGEDEGIDHGTPKPIECMERPMRNHEGDIYEPFAGTGTSIIAAERVGRTCYAMELDPGYCDVIRRRYAEFVGRPELAP